MDYKIELESTNAYEEILSLLKQDGYVNEDNTVNVVNLVDEELYTGKGSIENGDIYVLERREVIATTVETDQTSNLPYYLIYYNANKEDTVLGKVFESIDAVGLEFLEITNEGVVSLKGEYSYYGTGNETGNIALITEIKIPEYIDGIKITEIAPNAFSRCKNLETVVLPDSINKIGFTAFYECTNLKKINIPASLMEMDSSAFEGCGSLVDIIVPYNITCLTIFDFDETAWYENQSDGYIYFNNILYGYKGEFPQNAEISIDEGTRYIADYAFTGYLENLNLIAVTIPKSVTGIGSNTFYGCENLTTVNYTGTKEEWNKITIKSGNEELLNAVIHCSDGDIIPNA